MEDVTVQEVLYDANLSGTFDIADGFMLDDEVEEGLVSMNGPSGLSNNRLLMRQSPVSLLNSSSADKKKSDKKTEISSQKSDDGKGFQFHVKGTDAYSYELKLEGKIEAEYHLLPATASITSSLSLEQKTEVTLERKFVVKSKDREEGIKLKTIYIPTSTGINIPVDVIFLFSSEGKVKLVVKDSNSFSVGMIYKKGKTSFTEKYSGNRSADLMIEGSIETGLREETKLALAQLDILTVYAKAPLVNIDGKIEGTMEQVNFEKPTAKISAEADFEISLWAGVELDFLENKRETPDYNKKLLSWKSGNKSSSTSSSSKNSNDKQTDTEATMDSEATFSRDREQYRAVFEDYKLILDFADAGITMSDPSYGDFLRQIRTKINSWVIESVLNSPKDRYYAFYDVDKNGVSEMFIGSVGTDGKFYVTGFYYWNGFEPTLLAESFVAGHGGARSSLQVYTDGTVRSVGWSSGTGEGVAILYQLQKDNSEAKNLDQKDIKMGVDNLDVLFGKSEVLYLDLDKLKWREFEVSESTKQATITIPGMDVRAIASGDLSSIEGTWRSSAGYSFTIKGITYVGSDNKEYTIARISEYGGKVSWSLAEVMASPPNYVMFPVGVPLSTNARTYTSDESRDRIFLYPQYDAHKMILSFITKIIK